MRKSLEISYLISQLFVRYFFDSKILQNIAWNSCFSRDTFGGLKIWLFRQFCVQEFTSPAGTEEG